MKEGTRFWISILTLVALGVAAGIAWRVELETRFGWNALVWTTRFFRTVPAAVALFIVWAVCVSRVRHRAGFVGALMVFALPGYLAADVALQTTFGRFGPGLWIALPIWSMLPLSLCLLYRLFGAPVTFLKVIGSTLLFVFSWPLATFVRGFFEQRGGEDFIHALKSGFIIPFLVVSLGLPLLPIPAGIFRRKAVPIADAEAGQVS
jgi:hypothetical protein